MLYTNAERSLMAGAIQEGMRSKNIPQRPFANIIADALGKKQLAGRHVLDIGPGQCDFLDIAKQRGAHTYGVDFDPAIVRLGQLRGHEMLQANLMQAWPYEAAMFDGIFCRGSINCHWFASKGAMLEQFLDQLHAALKPGGWLWIAPWNRPIEGSSADIQDEVKATIQRWASKNGIELWHPDREHIDRYGIDYSIPTIQVWRKAVKVLPVSAVKPQRTKLTIRIDRKLRKAWRRMKGRLGLPGTRKGNTAEESGLEVAALRAWIEFLRSSPMDREANAPASSRQSSVSPVSKFAEDAPLPPAPLPMTYYEQGLRLLLERGDVEFITYDDLNWSNDWNYHRNYPGEWAAWNASLANKTRDPAKCYVLIQHDCDSGPVATVRMARLEQSLGIRSSIMVFERWKRGSELVAYPIDWEALGELRRQGFVIGYHCNAFHNSDFDEGGAYEQFARDYDGILGRKDIDVRYFSAHGGKASADGRLNSSFDWPLVCGRRQLRWVHNGHNVRFAETFSDGALTNRLKQNDPTLDFHAWIRSLKPGGRYRALLHPQYYTDGNVAPVADVTLAWYSNAIQSGSA